MTAWKRRLHLQLARTRQSCHWADRSHVDDRSGRISPIRSRPLHAATTATMWRPRGL